MVRLVVLVQIESILFLVRVALSRAPLGQFVFFESVTVPLGNFTQIARPFCADNFVRSSPLLHRLPVVGFSNAPDFVTHAELVIAAPDAGDSTKAVPTKRIPVMIEPSAIPSHRGVASLDIRHESQRIT